MITVVDNTSASSSKVYFQKLKECLDANGVPHNVVRTLKELNDAKPVTKAYILSGSPNHVHDMSKEQRALNAAAIKSGMPVLGICFGAQFICSYFGGDLARMSRFLCTSRIVTAQDAKDRFHARFCARYRLNTIPKCCVPTYSANIDGQKAAVVGFHHRTRPIHATLFHPEYFPDTQHIIIDFIKHT